MKGDSIVKASKNFEIPKKSRENMSDDARLR